MKRFVVFLLLAALTAGSAVAKPRRKPDHKVGKGLDKKADDDTVRVLVAYNQDLDDKKMDKVKGTGGQNLGRFSKLRIALHEMKARDARKLAEDPDVDGLALDSTVGASMDITQTATNTAAARSYGYTGAGIGVAVIDSGVTLNNDLRLTTTPTSASRIVYSQDFTGSGTTNDQFGHGTHVAGIIAGNGAYTTGANQKKNITGIAPAANIINLKVLDASGRGTDSGVIAAIDRAIELKATYNIRVINLSLGRAPADYYWNDPLCWAVERAYQAGIVVVASAGNQGRNNSGGNQGYGLIASPGIDPWVITVGAARTMLTNARADDAVTTYSSKGPTLWEGNVKPDLLAPGNLMASARAVNSTIEKSFPATIVPTSYYLTNGTTAAGNYLRLSGTSMATPVVAGTVALMLHKTPSLTPDVVKARLMRTASKSLAAPGTNLDPATLTTFPMYNDIFTLGAGYLDTQAALNSTLTGAGEAFSPWAWYDSTARLIRVEGDPTYDIWYLSSASFSLPSVYGTSALTSSSTAWTAPSSVLTDPTSRAFNVVWGDSIIWGESIVWGDASLAQSLAGGDR